MLNLKIGQTMVVTAMDWEKADKDTSKVNKLLYKYQKLSSKIEPEATEKKELGKQIKTLIKQIEKDHGITYPGFTLKDYK